MFKYIEKLEDVYRQAALDLDPDFNHLMHLRECLDKYYSKIISYINNCERQISIRDGQLLGLLKEYRSAIESIHRQNMDCLVLFCSACWPADSENINKKRWFVLQEDFFQKAQSIWYGLGKSSYFPVEPERIKEIIGLKYDVDHLDVNAVAWRVAHRQLLQKLYDLMMAVFVVNCREVKHKFRVTAAIYSIRSDTRGHLLSLKIRDYMKGYTFWLEEKYEAVILEALGRIAARFRKFRLFLLWGKALRVLMAAIIVLGFAWGLSNVNWDASFFRLVKFYFKEFFQQDYASMVLRDNKQYLEEQIEDIPNKYSVEKIRDEVEEFIRKKIYEQPDAYFYFSEHILKGFMLLISDWDVEQGFKDDVVEAARLLDPELSEPLQQIVLLFEAPVVREYALMNQMLEIKRVLVEKGTFPFMFIALKDDIPYIFVFNEKILEQYRLTISDIERTGLDKRAYNFLHKKPIVAYLVDGRQYPFKDRAGYFEGQYAVAFKSLSQNSEWTVYHEVAHLIDHIRFRVERILIPDNGEVNALLLPFVWASDKKAYLDLHMMPRVMRRDPLDFYSQGIKGILNGFHLYLTEQDLSLKKNMITNNFEPDRIKRIADQVRQLSDNEISDIGYTLYNEPDKYLATALPGKYITKISNIQEIIHGAPHGISKRGFILGGTGFSFGRNGPRFLIESMGSGDNWQGSFSLMSFFNNVLGVIFGRKNSLLQASITEALTAAALVFIGFNAFVFFLHALGSPWRKKMFYGTPLHDLIKYIYDRNGWSRGLSFGQESRERQLLLKIFKAEGDISQDLQKELSAFKSTADAKKRLLFDICLCLAPFNPRRTNIVNKLHDLLFFLPFLGPYLGRAPWIWRVQKAFHQKEAFNRKVAVLTGSLHRQVTPESLLENFQEIIESFGVASKDMVSDDQKLMNEFDSLSKYIFEYLPEEHQHFHMKMDFIMDQLSLFEERSQEFDRLDEYYPGDDIRHIDWKATARSTMAKPMIRKYSYPYGIKVALWVDLRSIHHAAEGRKWARDFVRSINVFNMLGAENILEKIFYVLNNGMVQEQVVNLRTSKNNFLTASKILSKMKDYQRAVARGQGSFHIEGLNFYESQENMVYLKNINLTDFGRGYQELNFVKVNAHRLNVFVIGSDIKDKPMIENIVGPSCKVFYL